MNKPIAMLVPESSKDILYNEFSDILTNPKNNILVRFMTDDEFNLMFNMNCSNISVDMTDEMFLTIAKMAHANDITFNNQVMNILKEQLKNNINDEITGSNEVLST